AMRATLGIEASPITKAFTSDPQAVTFGAPITIANPLGVEPKGWKLKARWKVAQYGYSVGDVIGAAETADGYTASYGIQVEVSASAIVLRVATAGFWVIRKDAAGSVALPAAANIELILEAWA